MPYSHLQKMQRRETDGRVPPGMTEEQLAFFAQEAERAARKGAHQGSRRMRNSALVGFLILVFGIGYVQRDSSQASDASRGAIVTSGRAVAVSGCNRDYADRVKFRTLLLRLRQSAAANKTSTPEQKQAWLKFYDDQLKDYSLLDCRKAEDVITADPDDLQPPAKPFFPGSDDPKMPRVPNGLEP